jgi:pteridine reductase
MKVAVFGGIGRLGVPIAEALVKDGNKAVVSYRKSRNSEKTANDLALRLGTENVMPVAAEISELSQAYHLIDVALKEFGQVDILINIASGFPGPKQWQRWKDKKPVTQEQWAYYSSNFLTARNCSAAAVDKAKNRIAIVNFSDARSLVYYDPTLLDPYADIGGIINAELEQIKKVGIAQLGAAPAVHQNPYTLAKRDIAYITAAMAVKYAEKARVCAVAPGPVLPSENSSKQMREKVVEQTLLKKWGTTAPVTSAVRFLIENNFITGQVLKIDGGQYLFHKFSKKQ